jgi:hypothetical protein
MDYLALYSAKCKTCKALDPEETKEYTNCHFNNGNKNCPAAEVQIAVVGEAMRFANIVKKARAGGDLKREVEILQEVGKRSAAFQQKFREWSSK